MIPSIGRNFWVRGNNFYEVYKSWRNAARHYSVESLVHISLDYLQQKVADKLEDVKRAPWQVLLIVKWVCQDINHNGYEKVSDHQFNKLRQSLWEFSDQLSHNTADNLPPRLFFRQLLHAQIKFQRKVSAGFVREGAILAGLPEKHSLRVLFKQTTQLDINDFLDFSFVTYCAILNGKAKINIGFYKEMEAKYGKSVLEAYICLVARTYPQLVTFFRNLPNSNNKFRSELFEFPVVSRYPFLLVNNQLNCWHESVFFRGTEDFVHSVLSEAGKDYIDKFSHLFEKHVLCEARKIEAEFYDEQALKKYLPKGAKVPDGLLSFRDCNVYIEAKAGLFDQSVMTVGNSQRFLHMTKCLRKAINQTWSAVIGIKQKASAPESLLTTDLNYLLVITNKELGASRGSTLAAMYPDSELDYPSSAIPSLLPLEHIYFLSIEAFERLVAGVVKQDKCLPEFLKGCVNDDANPSTSVYYFEQHLDRAGFRNDYSDLVAETIDKVQSRVIETLN